MAVLSYREAEAKKAEETALTSPPLAEHTEVMAPVEVTEEVPILTRPKPKIDDPWFRFEHPDMTKSCQPSGTLVLPIEGIEEKVEVKRGRVETQIPAVRDELLRMGYRWMNERFGA